MRREVLGPQAWIAALALCCFCGCVARTTDPHRVATAHRLVEMATEHRQVFVELERLIEGDTDLAYVGLDRIEGYWRCRDGWTTHQQPYTKISESEMLAAVGMSHERAHTFRSLLRQVGALAVEKGDGYVRFPMEISGTLVTGATWSLFHGTSLPADAELVGEITYQHISQPGEKYLYERINGDWYVEYVAQ